MFNGVEHIWHELMHQMSRNGDVDVFHYELLCEYFQELLLKSSSFSYMYNHKKISSYQYPIISEDVL